MSFLRDDEVYRAYKFKLQLNEEEKKFFHSNTGASRLAYNWSLDQIKLIGSKGEEELKSLYGTFFQNKDDIDDKFKRSKLLNKFFLRKYWNSIKEKETFIQENQSSWWSQNSSRSYRTGIDNCVAA